MSDGDKSLEALLRGASPRPEPPPEVRDRVFAAVEREWHARNRRRFRPMTAVAAAAAVAILIGVTFLRQGEAFIVELTATESVWVNGEHLDSGDRRLRVSPGTQMVADAVAGLTTSSGTDLRLRAGSEISWLGPDVIRLEDGALYVATEGSNHMEIRTPMGVVTDIGTRFMVTLEDGALEVAMREGITEIATSHGTYVAEAEAFSGDVVRVADNRISARSEPASDDRWRWIHEVHPGYTETHVAGLLAAIATDLGVPLAFSSPAVKASTLSLELTGDLSGLPPRDALTVVLETSGLQLLSDDGARLLIGFQSTPD